jgi:hypothetical protein
MVNSKRIGYLNQGARTVPAHARKRAADAVSRSLSSGL